MPGSNGLTNSEWPVAMPHLGQWRTSTREGSSSIMVGRGQGVYQRPVITINVGQWCGPKGLIKYGLHWPLKEAFEVRFEMWEGYYKAILGSMNYDRDRDEVCAYTLSSLLAERTDQLLPLTQLEAMLRGQHVFVFGDGPTLAEDIVGFEFRSVKVAADGATTKLMDRDVLPDIIVTDLDGGVEDQVEANRRGALVIVHAHGDNQDLVRDWVPRFEGRLLGTTQSRPLEHVENFGGFTDGDRCAFMCDHFGAASIILVAFNFDDTDQEYVRSLGENKLKKLTWGGMLLSAIEGSELFFFEDLVEVYRGGAAPQAVDDVESLAQDIVEAYTPPGDRPAS